MAVEGCFDTLKMETQNSCHWQQEIMRMELKIFIRIAAALSSTRMGEHEESGAEHKSLSKGSLLILRQKAEKQKKRSREEERKAEKKRREWCKRGRSI